MTIRPHRFAALAAFLIAAPAGAADLLTGSSWALLTPPGGGALRPAPGGALHVTVTRPVKDYYLVQLTHDVAAPLPAGAAVRYHFQARSATRSPIHAVLEKRTAPYTRVLDRAVTLTPAWKDYAFTARVPAAFGPRGLAARLQVGQQAGSVEFRAISLGRS